MQSINNHQNRFPLVGAHAMLMCDQCHKGAAVSQFQGLSTQCVSCHVQDLTTAQPDHRALQFPTTCEGCHNMDTWMGARFDHAKYTGYALTGMHATLDCQACHVNGNFQVTSTNCVSCHLKDFTGTQNPNHVQAGFSQDCSTCHNTANWTSVTFNHNLTAFPLTGAHVSVQCAQCHVNNNYNLTSADCVSCHLTDFRGTTNPNHVQSGFPTACQQCHNTTTWTNATFDHSTTGFPLTGAHITVQCQLCHVNNNYNLSSANTPCVSCHLTDFRGTTNPNHVQSGFPQTCEQCHNTTTWTNATFDHSTMGFPLTGAHVTVQCQLCHVNNNYNLTSANTPCVSCHLTDFRGTTNPNHVQSGFSQTCEQYHNTTSWTNATFDHSTTGFPLTGAHTTVQCQLCHVNNNYNLSSANTPCVSCHLTDFNGTTNPNHVQSGFPQACEQCHNTASWTNATFNHNNTGFPLTGAHTTVQCALCHVNNNYNLTNTDCVSCHLADFKGTTNPNHVQSGFPTTCLQCHTTASWANATFDHSTTGFPLTGAHTTVLCAQCHVNGNYTLGAANTACVACHLTDYNGTTSPNHVQAAFPTTCQQCHTTASWGNATFDHSTTGFALTGAHTTVLCAQCHLNGNYTLGAANATCIACHLTDYNGTTNPNHAQAAFPTTCLQCHTTAAWGSATFDHSTTGFALTGAHATALCTLCHVNGNYTLGAANTTCIACHQTDYSTTNNPPHAAANFATTCQQCHTTATWLTATFDHSTTGFALTGFHTTVACVQCHVGNNYTLGAANTACYSCHQADFTGTTNPAHVAAGFPTDCTICHTTTNWTSATFNHATTGFTLTGFHTSLTCVQCHVGNNYALTTANTLCYSCHQADFNGTNNPAHVAAGFPTDCSVCHTTVDWTGATFNHATTPFPLTGAHVTVACTSCHINNVFAGTPTDCYSCHKTDYTGTTNPNHVAAGFPTTCATCHTTTAWTGATFTHTWFPEPHHTATLCSDCHTNSADYSVFTCTVCHTAAQTNPEHSGVKGYVWNSANCYACHPKGNGG